MEPRLDFLGDEDDRALGALPVTPGFPRPLSLIPNTISLLARFPLLRGFLFQVSLVPKTIELSPSFAFLLCLTCPALFFISAIALTLELLSSTGALPLSVYTPSAVSLGGCHVGTSGASSLCLVLEYVPAAKRTWLRASVELFQLGARDAVSEDPPSQQ
ncbi:hypothetical protein PC121_g12965 [Phytophthora cactorum]|nr:hypothetical protein PC121_g12965 [Phytophthora cactorum]